MFNDLFFFCLFLSETFYLSHTEGSYTDWGRGVAQERDLDTGNLQVVLRNISYGCHLCVN